MQKYTIIRTMSKTTYEVKHSIGLQVEQAWRDGAKTIHFGDTTLRGSTITEVEHLQRSRATPKAVLDKPHHERATEESPGYLKFKQARENLTI